MWEYILGSLRRKRRLESEGMRDGSTMEERDWIADWIFSEVSKVNVTVDVEWETVAGVVVSPSDIV